MIAMPPAMPASRQTAPAAAPAPSVAVEAPAIVQTVTVAPVAARSDLLVGTENWTWVELRDYVVAQIVDRFGPFPRDSRKEHAIFNRFISTFGAEAAAAIAQYAFGPSCDGWWGSAPIQIQRFCKGSDPYFANVILQRLADTGSTTPA